MAMLYGFQPGVEKNFREQHGTPKKAGLAVELVARPGGFKFTPRPVLTGRMPVKDVCHTLRSVR